MKKPPTKLISSASEMENVKEVRKYSNKKMLNQAMEIAREKNTKYIIDSIDNSNINNKSQSYIIPIEDKYMYIKY